MSAFWDWVIREGAFRNRKNCPYWGDGGAGVIPVAKNTGRLLINQRSMYVNEGGTYGIFGGGIFLDDTEFESIEELAQSNYPQQHALEELKEETGYTGPIQMQELFVYKDNKTNRNGDPCNFYYWNFAGICPAEFPVSPGAGHEWENGDGSRWMTVTELFSLRPLHFGLKSVVQNAGGKLSQLVQGLGFQGNEQYPNQVIDS